MTNNYTKILNSLPSSIPFVGPEAQERILDKFFDSRIGANESVFGPSPEALKAMKDKLSSLWMYGDPENYDLKIEIAKKHNVKPENIIFQLSVPLEIAIERNNKRDKSDKETEDELRERFSLNSDAVFLGEHYNFIDATVSFKNVLMEVSGAIWFSKI